MTSRQKYKDGTLADAQALGCNIVQFKYDGNWALIKCADGVAKVYSQTGLLKATITIPPYHQCTLIGEYLVGTQWAQNPIHKGSIRVFDCWQEHGKSLLELSYRQRYGIAQNAVSTFREPFKMVPNFHIRDRDNIWSMVENGDYEGVVYRYSEDPVDVTLIREKKRKTYDLLCVDFIEGEGKHSGKLGALVGVIGSTTVNVGGGFNDAQRENIWAYREEFRNRIFEVEAYAQFESGSLRHPQFLRWRDDK